MELVLIKQDSPEWEFMWNWLESHPLNKGLENPSLATNGTESWQYMGSLQNKKVVIHQFRHRNHPVTQSIQSVSVNSSEAFTTDQIHRESKI
jgi:hypothetical protein